jgi:hypothetical protein
MKLYDFYKKAQKIKLNLRKISYREQNHIWRKVSLLIHVHEEICKFFVCLSVFLSVCLSVFFLTVHPCGRSPAPVKKETVRGLADRPLPCSNSSWPLHQNQLLRHMQNGEKSIFNRCLLDDKLLDSHSRTQDYSIALRQLLCSSINKTSFWEKHERSLVQFDAADGAIDRLEEPCGILAEYRVFRRDTLTLRSV